MPPFLLFKREINPWIIKKIGIKKLEKPKNVYKILEKYAPNGPIILSTSLLLLTKFIPGSVELKDMREIKENIAKIIKRRAFIFSTINNRITVT